MEQSINRRNKRCSGRSGHWVATFCFQFFIFSVSVSAQEDKKGEPPQAQPDAGSGETKPEADTGATDSTKQTPKTQTPTEEAQPPSQPDGEQQTPSQPEPAQPIPSASDAPSASNAGTSDEVKPTPVETTASKPEATPTAAAKPIAPRPQRIDTEERRPSVPVQRAQTLCANGRTAVENKRSQWPPVRVNGELAFLASRNEGTTSTWLSPLLGAWFRVSDMVAISADWGFAMLNWSAIDDADDTAFRTGNPFLAVHSVRQHGCTELRVGIGATVPLAYSPDKDGDRNFARELYQGAMAMRGMWNWWLWTPDSLSVALPVSWETAASTNWIFGGEIALASTVFFDDRDEYFLPVEISLQALLAIPFMGKVGYRIDPFIFSIELRAVWIVNDGLLQTSAVPGVRLNIGTGYIQTKFNLNLDRPYGIGSEYLRSSKMWGLHLGGGIEF